MRPSATALAQRAVAGMPPKEKKCGTISAGAASASARIKSSGVVKCKHLPHQAGAARQSLRGGAHAAAARVAHQRCEARRPGKPDAYAVLEAEAAHAGDKVEDRSRLETKLRHDFDRKPGRFRGGDLVGERAVELVVADARMALRIAGDANAADAAPAQTRRCR